tara:strand:- start:33862 stop:34644 length:783 start_codon:yes stop_codon:yes gene_type:complete
MTTQTDKTTCWIPKCQLPALREMVERLDRKAKKLGMASFEINVLEEAVKPWAREKLDLEDRLSHFKLEQIVAVKVAVSGEPPKLDGYRLLARIDMAANQAARGTPLEWAYSRLPEPYRSGDATGDCSHCNKRRERRYLFLMEEMSIGVVLEVGKTCLKDYLGHQGAESMMARAQLLVSVINMMEEIDEVGICGGRPPDAVVELRWLVAAAVRQIRERGFVSRARAEETGDLATAEIVGEMARSVPMVSKRMKACVSEDVA